MWAADLFHSQASVFMSLDDVSLCPLLGVQALPHDGKALIQARWPAEGLARDIEAESQYRSLQSAVRAIRNARAEYNVEISKKIAATIVAKVGSSQAEQYVASSAECPSVAPIVQPLPIHNTHGNSRRRAFLLAPQSGGGQGRGGAELNASVCGRPLQDDKLRAALDQERAVIASLAKLEPEQTSVVGERPPRGEGAK